MQSLRPEQLTSSEVANNANGYSPSPSAPVTTSSQLSHHRVVFRVLAFLAFTLCVFFALDAFVRVALAALDRDLQLLLSGAFSGAISFSSLVVLAACYVSGSEK
jgi:di/tricarboxylate transporter